MMKNYSRSKYNVSKDASKRTYNNIVFDSELEMKFYRDVILPHSKTGAIVHYELQKKYNLQPSFKHNGITVRAIDYVSDFYIELSDGRNIVIDTKGFPDTTAKMKRKMFLYKHNDKEMYWVCFSAMDGGWCDYEFVKKQRVLRKKKTKNQRN